MNISFNASLARQYISKSQIARVLTESWTEENMYCPVCGFSHVSKFPNNRAVADFYCPNCKSEFEQKSKNGAIGSKIADGAYATFIERICSNNNPDFFIMSYSISKMSVESMYFIPKHFFVPEIVEKRKPLSSSAQRANWVGCNILFNQIPKQGCIPIIQNGLPINKSTVVEQVNKVQAIKIDDLSARGWLLDVLQCVNAIENVVFSLSMVYGFDSVLSRKYPNNHNIRAKIRQQLQLLRDMGVIAFEGNGTYRKLLP